MTVAAVAAALVSCNREKEVEVVEPAGDVTYRFELVGGTKATLDDDGVWWETNDHVGVFLGSQDNEAEVKGTDTKYVEVITNQQNISKGYAYYPYSANSSAGNVTVNFPAAQTGGSNAAMPMAGIPFDVTSGSFNGQIHFLNLGSVIDFRVFSPSGKYAGELVKSITFAATEGSHLAGSAKLDLTAVNPANEASLAVSWTGGTPQSSVTLTQSSASAMDKVTASGRHLYMVVAPGTYSGTITIETNAATYNYTVTNKAFTRGGLQRFNMNLESGNATRVLPCEKVNSLQGLTDGGSYLIVYTGSTPAKVFHPELNGSSYTGNSVDVTITDKGIQTEESLSACFVVLEKASGNQNQFYIKVPSANNSYLDLSSGYGSYSIGTGQNALTFNFENESVQISRTVSNMMGQTTCYLRYNNNSFTASTTASSFALYKVTEDELTAQNPRFSTSTYPFYLRGQSLPIIINATDVPSLTGALTNVTYYSSNTAVATVNANNGTLEIKSTGETVITAVADATEEYKQATASYKLTVESDVVFEDGGEFCVENDQVAAFLNHEEENPYDPNNYGYTYVLDYRSGTGENNRLDCPKPFHVTWTSSISNSEVTVYKDNSLTQQELSAVVETTSSSADIYSLTPGKTYYYVVKDGGQTKKAGHFQATGRRRMILVGDRSYGRCYANNCRDFGGQIGMNGRRVKFGKIYRGTNMDNTTEAQKNYLIHGMNIRLDVDLRVANATQASNDPGKYKVTNVYALDPTIVTRTPEEYNSWSDLTNKTRISGTLGAIFDYVNNNKGAVYIHCKIGSDRTGYVCLLLEALLGIPQHLCDVDYELTSFCGCLDGGDTRTRDNTNESWYYYRRDGISFLTGIQDTNNTLTTLQEKAVYYVTHELGFTTKQVTDFQEAMLESK